MVVPAPPKRARVRHGLILAAILTGPAWIIGIVAALVPAQWARWFAVIPVLFAIVVVSQVFRGSRLGMVLCCVLAGLAAILTFVWAPLAVLTMRGEPVSAIVTGEHLVPGKGHTYHRYDLSVDGRPILELLDYDAAFALGDHVDVVVDRQRQLDPVTADALDEERGVGIAAAGVLLLTTALSIGIGSRATIERVDLRLRSRYRTRH